MPQELNPAQEHQGDHPAYAPYTVCPGDTLWKIADRCLGDPIRWPQIYALSRDLTQPDGQRLTDPDLLRPGWHLRLPADARQPTPPELTPTHDISSGHTDPTPSPPPNSPKTDVTEAELSERNTIPDGGSGDRSVASEDRPVRISVGHASAIGITTAAGIAAAVSLARAHARRRRKTDLSAQVPQLAEAVRAATHAIHAAHRAEQDEAGAHASGITRRPAPSLPAPPGTVTFARGAALAPQQPAGTVSVWLHSLQARAHAVLGDAGAARDAVRNAETAREAVTADDLDAIGGLLTFPRVRQLYYTAEAEVLRPDSEEAEQYAQTAVDAYRAAAGTADWAFGDEAGARTTLALARIGADALDGAEEAMRPVLDLPAEMRLAGVVLSAHRVHQALSAAPVQAALPARSLRAEIEAFSAASTRALPR